MKFEISLLRSEMTDPVLVYHKPVQFSDLTCTTLAAQNQTLCSIASLKRSPFLLGIWSAEQIETNFHQILFRCRMWSSGPFSALFFFLEQPNSGSFVNTNALDSSLEALLATATTGGKFERQLISPFVTSKCVAGDTWVLNFEKDVTNICKKWYNQITDEDPDFDTKKTEMNLCVYTLQQQVQTVTMRPHCFLTISETSNVKGLESLNPARILKSRKRKMRM